MAGEKLTLKSLSDKISALREERDIASQIIIERLEVLENKSKRETDSAWTKFQTWRKGTYVDELFFGVMVTILLCVYAARKDWWIFAGG